MVVKGGSRRMGKGVGVFLLLLVFLFCFVLFLSGEF